MAVRIVFSGGSEVTVKGTIVEVRQALTGGYTDYIGYRLERGGGEVWVNNQQVAYFEDLGDTEAA